MVSLDGIILKMDLEQFKTEISLGISDSCNNCVEIMRSAFGKDYTFSPILNQLLTKLYEDSINALLSDDKIVRCNEFTGIGGKTSVFTASYKKA